MLRDTSMLEKVCGLGRGLELQAKLYYRDH